MPRKTRDVHIGMPHDLYAKLKKLAEKGRRPVNTEILIALEKHTGKKNA